MQRVKVFLSLSLSFPFLLLRTTRRPFISEANEEEAGREKDTRRWTPPPPSPFHLRGWSPECRSEPQLQSFGCPLPVVNSFFEWGVAVHDSHILEFGPLQAIPNHVYSVNAAECEATSAAGRHDGEAGGLKPFAVCEFLPLSRFVCVLRIAKASRRIRVASRDIFGLFFGRLAAKTSVCLSGGRADEASCRLLCCRPP